MRCMKTKTTHGDKDPNPRNKYNLTPETARVGVQMGKVTSGALHSPSPDSLPRAHPRVAVAAVRHSRSHQPSLALPPVPEAPPLTSTPSPPSHTSGRALQRLPRPLLQASAAEIAGDRVPSLTPPRAPRGHRRNPCEPPVDSPLLPASISRPSHRCT